MLDSYFRFDAGRETLGTRATENIPQVQTDWLSAPDWKGLFPQGVPVPSLQLWYGGPGTGKTRLALRLCTHLGVTACAALEMGRDRTIEFAEQSGSELSHLWPYESFAELWHDLPIIEPRCIVVDSLAFVRNAKTTLKQLERWALENSGLVVVINQVNANGRSRGGPTSAHKVDIELQLVKAREGFARFITRKNRFSLPTGEPVYSLGA